MNMCVINEAYGNANPLKPFISCLFIHFPGHFYNDTFSPLARHSFQQARKRILINFAHMNFSSSLDHSDLSNDP